MTQFEYMAIAPSLILSFSLARVLSNLGSVFMSKNRYWVHSAWAALLVANHILIFWSYWFFHLNQEWSLFEFVLFLIHPVALLISTSLLFPNDQVTDYRVFFGSVRTPFYAVWAAGLLADPFLSWTTLGMPIIHAANLASVTLILGFIAGITLKRSTVDAALIVAVILLEATVWWLAGTTEGFLDFLEG